MCQRFMLSAGILCVLAALGVPGVAAASLKAREAELRRAIALAQHGKLGICNTVADCPAWNKGGTCRNGRCACPNGLAGLFCLKKKGAAPQTKAAAAAAAPAPAPTTLAPGTHSCLHKVRLCQSKADCNPTHCAGCSCDPCGQCACVDPFRGAFCEELTRAPTPAPTPKCHAARTCTADGGCNEACDGCTCTGCGQCACTDEYSGAACATKTRKWYQNADAQQGIPYCKSHADCNGHACPDCKCLTTGKCACTLDYSGAFCTGHERAKSAVPMWQRACQVAQDCNWPRCAACTCGKDFTCGCAPGFHGANCDNKHGTGKAGAGGSAAAAGGGGAAQAAAAGATAAATAPTAAPASLPPRPTPRPGPTTTPWPTPIVQCFAEGDCNYPVCATCSCFHGGCRCAEGWGGIFCTERATKAPVVVAVPTPAPPLPDLIPGPDQLPCYVDRDCAMAKGASCYRGVCKCPKGTTGMTCESDAKPTPKPTPAPTPFDLKDLKLAKGTVPCFSQGDCNWRHGGRCVDHQCACGPGYSGMGCMNGPTPAPSPKGVALDTSAYVYEPTTPHPTPVLGCKTTGDCNHIECKTCRCHWGGCICTEGFRGNWCQDHAAVPITAKKTKTTKTTKTKKGAAGNGGLTSVLQKVEALKAKMAAMWSGTALTEAPRIAQKGLAQGRKAHYLFDKAFGYDDKASAGSAAGAVGGSGGAAYYAQQFWPGSKEEHDATFKAKHYWPKGNMFPSHNRR